MKFTINQSFSTLRPYSPFFWPQTNSTRWYHNFPMFWGNSGYLRFSVTCPFGCSAGRFLAPMAQNGPFWAKKAMQWPSWRPNCNRIKLPFWCLVVMVTKNLMPFKKVWILAPKNAFLSRKSAWRRRAMSLFTVYKEELDPGDRERSPWHWEMKTPSGTFNKTIWSNFSAKCNF